MNEPRVDSPDLEQLVGEHAQLREILLELGETLERRIAQPEILVGLFEQFTELVTAHFDHEEEGGYFADVVATAPRLNGEVSNLLAEHSEFRVNLAAIRRLAAGGDSSDQWWSRVEAAFRDFSRRFIKHEQSENTLVHEAYGRDIGAED